MAIVSDTFTHWLASRCAQYSGEWAQRGDRAAPGSPMRFQAYAMGKAFAALADVRTALRYLAEHYHEFADTHATLLHSTGAQEADGGASEIRVVCDEHAMCELWLQRTLAHVGSGALPTGALAKQWITSHAARGAAPSLARPGCVAGQVLVCPGIVVDPERALVLTALVGGATGAVLASSVLLPSEDHLLVVGDARGAAAVRVEAALRRVGFRRVVRLSDDLSKVMRIGTPDVCVSAVDTDAGTVTPLHDPGASDRVFAAEAGLLQGGLCNTALVAWARSGGAHALFVAIDTGDFAPVARGARGAPGGAEVLLVPCTEHPESYTSWERALAHAASGSVAEPSLLRGPQGWRMAVALCAAAGCSTGASPVRDLMQLSPDGPPTGAADELALREAVSLLADAHRAVRSSSGRAIGLRRRLDSRPGSLQRLAELGTVDNFHAHGDAGGDGGAANEAGADASAHRPAPSKRRRVRKRGASGSKQILTVAACGPENPVEDRVAVAATQLRAAEHLVGVCAERMRDDPSRCESLLTEMAVHMMCSHAGTAAAATEAGGEGGAGDGHESAAAAAARSVAVAVPACGESGFGA